MEVLGRAVEENLTAELLEQFLGDLQIRGRSEVSLKEYRRVLRFLYESLPEGKRVSASTGPQWKHWLEQQGFGPRTVNMRMSVWNSLMQYMGHREWQVEGRVQPEGVQPELTRSEYLRMLSAAKQTGQEKPYLLIKTLGGVGLRIQELPQLTAEAVREGGVRLERQNGSGVRMLHLPKVLQRELLEYISREGIKEGPVFATSSGRPLDRSNIGSCIKRISRDARVPEEKASPRCLWKMYLSTQEGIQSNVAILIEQAYERMLEQEQLTIGWDRY